MANQRFHHFHFRIRAACEEKARRASTWRPELEHKSCCLCMCTPRYVYNVADFSTVVAGKVRRKGQTGHLEDWRWSWRMDGSPPSAMSSIITLQYVCLWTRWLSGIEYDLRRHPRAERKGLTIKSGVQISQGIRMARPLQMALC